LPNERLNGRGWPNPHLGFGIGTHFRLGANLARAEIKTVFTELFKRLRDIEITAGAPLDRGDSPW
jgi:cytochrome P450